MSERPEPDEYWRELERSIVRRWCWKVVRTPGRYGIGLELHLLEFLIAIRLGSFFVSWGVQVEEWVHSERTFKPFTGNNSDAHSD